MMTNYRKLERSSSNNKTCLVFKESMFIHVAKSPLASVVNFILIKIKLPPESCNKYIQIWAAPSSKRIQSVFSLKFVSYFIL